jgi:DNA gyrase/topoisomerase IV subunit A
LNILRDVSIEDLIADENVVITSHAGYIKRTNQLKRLNEKRTKDKRQLSSR